MFTKASPFARALATATILGGLALAMPSFAADDAGAMGSKSTSSHATKAAAKSHKPPTPEEMQERVATRISNLHDKLKITPEQEGPWNEVAQTMRDNEAAMSQLMQERQANSETRNAVQDLESYQKIAQAHADGLKKLGSSFDNLYDDMSDAQKKNADEVFGSFEGHRGIAKVGGHGMRAKKPAAPATSSDE